MGGATTTEKKTKQDKKKVEITSTYLSVCLLFFLSISSSPSSLLISAHLSHISLISSFGQAVYHELSDAQMAENLKTIGCQPPQVACFGQCWAQKGADVIASFRNQAFFDKRVK